jgi:alpha-beta hydrolase superfamily lysophospholipase
MRTVEQALLNLSGYKDYNETLIDSAGTKIALSIYRSKKGVPCVIFLPGTMTHPLFYDDFLTALAERGFNVIGVHFLSHGKSLREREVYTFDDMVQNVQDAIAFCIGHFNSNIIVMGSSQGGILSMAVAAKDSRVKAVFAHNLLLPTLKESISITNFPSWLKLFYGIFPPVMKFLARLMPKLKVPITAYLDFDRITSSPETQVGFYQDPIGLTSYPLSFLASLFTADLSGITDGSIKCPVVVIASKGDPLFSFSYCCTAFEKIAAPRKEMLVFDEPCHLILNECVDKVIEPIAESLKRHFGAK